LWFLPNNPNPVQYPLDYKCGLGLVGYTGTALTTQLVLTPVQHPRMGLKTPATDALPLTDLWRKTGATSTGKPGNDAPTAGS